MQRGDVDDRLPGARLGGPVDANEDLVAFPGDRDAVPEVAAGDQRLRSAEAAEATDGQGRRRERREGAAAGGLLADALDDFGPEEVSLLSHRLVDGVLDALGLTS